MAATIVQNLHTYAHQSSSFYLSWFNGTRSDILLLKAHTENLFFTDPQASQTYLKSVQDAFGSLCYKQGLDREFSSEGWKLTLISKLGCLGLYKPVPYSCHLGKFFFLWMLAAGLLMPLSSLRLPLLMVLPMFPKQLQTRTEKNVSKLLLWAQSPQTTSGVALDHSCSSLSSSSIAASQLFVSKTSHAVFTRSASLGRHSLKPQHLVVGLLLHLQGNSIHMLSAPDSSLLPAGQALWLTSIFYSLTQRKI